MQSYRQKLIDLAKIYRISEILINQKQISTFEIELILLKKKVPIPSGKGLIELKFRRIIVRPLTSSLRNVSDFFNKINKNINNITNKKINNFRYTINFLFKSTFNLFTYAGNTVVDFLNNIYNFKVEENTFNKVISRTSALALILIVGFSLFYLKEIVTSVDSVKISLIIKSDKLEKNNTELKKDKKPDILTKIPKENLIVKKKDEVVKLKKKLTKPEPKKKVAKLPSLTKKNPNSFGLNTETVLNLFEDLDYDLKKVRIKKEVKPIYFTRFPVDLNSIPSMQLKKDTFIKIILPLVLAENKKISLDREKIKLLDGKKMTNDKEKEWLRKKFREYKVDNGRLKDLLQKVDTIPTSIALAQAAKESGWGTSRFALEGNAIFGQWTWNGSGIEPLEKTEGQRHKILKFPILRASVKAYISNLNTHKGYKDFRVKRSELRKKNKVVLGIKLIHELDNYAETGKEYTKILEKIINQNNLSDFENVKLLEKDGDTQLAL